MKKFVVFLSNKRRNLMTRELMAEHASYLESLKEKGVLPFCGPCKDGTALMILVADNYEEARSIVEEDPFARVDYYRERKIVEVEEATSENHFLVEKVFATLK
ncbi:YciI family protein [Pontibacillus salicampi]|uniref:YciI family protein n=1 Tax=Pontibacillus salicampi TaxID=1449801 RepID=A0ABV6LQC1_9BACI